MEKFMLIEEFIFRKEDVQKIYIIEKQKYEIKQDVVYIPNKGLLKKGTFSKIKKTIKKDLPSNYAIKVFFKNHDSYIFFEFENKEDAKKKLEKILLFLNR